MGKPIAEQHAEIRAKMNPDMFFAPLKPATPPKPVNPFKDLPLDHKLLIMSWFDYITSKQQYGSSLSAAMNTDWFRQGVAWRKEL